MEQINEQAIKTAKQYDRERSKRYYEANKQRIKEKYHSATPEQKHERSEAQSQKR